MAPIADLGSFLRTTPRRPDACRRRAGAHPRLVAAHHPDDPALAVGDNPDLRLVVYTAEPGSPSATALELAHA